MDNFKVKENEDLVCRFFNDTITITITYTQPCNGDVVYSDILLYIQSYSPLPPGLTNISDTLLRFLSNMY